MRISFVLGFSYERYGSRHHPLPGIIIDIYHAYLFAKRISSDRIIVITDIYQDGDVTSLVNSMVNSIVDTDIISFISDIKKKGEHFAYVSRDNILKIFYDYFPEADEIFIYYSGHTSLTHILVPENLHSVSVDLPFRVPMEKDIPLRFIRELLILRTHSDSRILLVLDSCYGSGMGIPYKLCEEDDRYRLLLQEENLTFSTQRMILFTSSLFDEKSITTSDGSIFTNSLFKNLTTKEMFIPELLRKIKEDCKERRQSARQSATFYASHPNLFVLWSWIYGIGIDVEFDAVGKIFVIRKKKRSESKNVA